jgi:hypothetical protein
MSFRLADTKYQQERGNTVLGYPINLLLGTTFLQLYLHFDNPAIEVDSIEHPAFRTEVFRSMSKSWNMSRSGQSLAREFRTGRYETTFSIVHSRS